jgi:hypothetical protein
MTPADRMTCPTCGRDVAVRLVRGPRINAGRPIPALRVPIRHKRLEADGTLGEICEPRRIPATRDQPDVDHRGEDDWRGTTAINTKGRL